MASRSGRRGAMLLEVVLALSILLIAIAVCGLALNNNLADVKKGESLTRAMLLTEELLTRVDAGQIQMDQTEQSGEFGDPDTRSESDPLFSYSLSIVPVEQEPDILRVEATIFERNPSDSTDGAKQVLVTKTLRAKPRPLNLKEDFGMSDEQLQMLTDSVPGGTQVLDPENFDPRSIAQLDMDTLAQLMPLIMQAMSSGQLSGQDLSKMGQGGGLPSGLTGQLQQAAGGSSSGGQTSGSGSTRGSGRSSGSSRPPTRSGGSGS